MSLLAVLLVLISCIERQKNTFKIWQVSVFGRLQDLVKKSVFYLNEEILESIKVLILARFVGVCEVKESSLISIIAEYVSATS